METYECYGLKTKNDLRNIPPNVNVASVLTDVLAIAEAHSGTVEYVTERSANQMRKTAVIDAVKHELVNRMNDRIAMQWPLPSDNPRPPLNYLANSMAHARGHAVKFLDMAISAQRKE